MKCLLIKLQLNQNYYGGLCLRVRIFLFEYVSVHHINSHFAFKPIDDQSVTFISHKIRIIHTIFLLLLVFIIGGQNAQKQLCFDLYYDFFV